MATTFFEPTLSDRQKSYLTHLDEALRMEGLNVDFNSKGMQAFIHDLQTIEAADESARCMESMIRRASWLV